MYLFHDSRQARYRCPFGAAAVGSTITLSLDAQLPQGSRAQLRLWRDEETLLPMNMREGGFSISLPLPETPGLLWYYFVIDTPAERVYYGKHPGQKIGRGDIFKYPPESWQITVYRPRPLPEWYENAVAYQIFPDRFHRGRDWEARQTAAAHPAHWQGTKRIVLQDWNDTPFYCKDSAGRVIRWPFFGGTLEGIREKLLYLQSLGIGVIYLNPIFSASSNHKYDTADYHTIDPGFGDTEAFVTLCREARNMGIRILLDGVFSHTGDDSIYFNRYGNYPQPGAFSHEKSPYDNWYRFSPEHPAGYECWWGVDSLPNVEENDPSYREFLCGTDGVIRSWLRLGASGWRLDVADELPDSLIRAISESAKAEKKDALILGEVWEDASNKVSYEELRKYLLGEELDCTMHYPFRTGALDFLLGRQDAAGFAADMETIHENYPPSAFYGALNLIGTHDTPRILTVLGEAPETLSEQEQENFQLDGHHRYLAETRLQLLQILQFTFPGIPCVYYGDEAGMEGFADPYNRGPFPWGRENGGLQFHVRYLSHLRQEYPVFRSGSFLPRSPHPDIFGLERRLEDAVAKIYVNRSQVPVSIPYPENFGASLDLLTGKSYDRETNVLSLPALSGVVLYREGWDENSFSSLSQSARLPQGPGLLCPLFSLPGTGSVGNLGTDASAFLEVLHRRNYVNWMLLPLCPPGDGDSPYSSRCLFAGDPRLLDPEVPVSMDGFAAFCQENESWLTDYALYTALRKHFNTPWQQWPQPERDRENLAELLSRYAQEIWEIQEQQYRFFQQWEALHQQAREKGISLIGDLPIYAALDSAETWANRELFHLDKTGYPTLRAGCPPDYFAKDGQDWGNPLYRWDVMEQDGYQWWKQRLRQAFSMYDAVRLDHFRAFAAYYTIPAGSPARDGLWLKGPGIAFFREMAKEFGSLPLIAEDLGTLDAQVTCLLQLTGLPGMNVWQFSASEMAAMSPQEASRRVFFSGTHDNQTLRGYLDSTGDARSPKEICAELLASPAAAVILPVQDVLGLGDETRINVPGVPTGSWRWRMTQEQLEQLRSLNNRHL